MRWDEEHESPDLIDRRGESPARGAGVNVGGLLWLVPWLMRSWFGRIVLLIAVIVGVVWWLGGRFLQGGAGEGGAPVRTRTEESPMVHFVSFVLDDTQATWQKELAPRGVSYRHAKLVLYTDATSTGCGYGDAATGPFYCPTDERVYLDLGFFAELEKRLGARGDFAKAYVIAHEIGHHVQKVLGTSDKMPRTHLQGATGASVRLELQADCYAGIWAHSTNERHILEGGDIESALGAARAVGDDRLQRQATGTVSPEKWTHGSSEERARWFRRGYDTGKLESCDTFNAPSL